MYTLQKYIIRVIAAVTLDPRPAVEGQTLYLVCVNMHVKPIWINAQTANTALELKVCR